MMITVLIIRIAKVESIKVLNDEKKNRIISNASEIYTYIDLIYFMFVM